jgi:hypothetical protein
MRFGVVALMLGLASVAVLCVPYLGYYASFALSGVGLLVGLWGLVRGRRPDAAAAGGTMDSSGVAGSDRNSLLFPLVGMMVSLGAVLLALLGPYLFSPP